MIVDGLPAAAEAIEQLLDLHAAQWRHAASTGYAFALGEIVERIAEHGDILSAGLVDDVIGYDSVDNIVPARMLIEQHNSAY